MHKYKHRHKRQANAVHDLRADEYGLQQACTMLFQIGSALASSLLPFTRKTKSYGGASKLGKAYGLALASESVANIGKSQGTNNLDKAMETMGHGY